MLKYEKFKELDELPACPDFAIIVDKETGQARDEYYQQVLLCMRKDSCRHFNRRGCSISVDGWRKNVGEMDPVNIIKA